MQFESRSTRFFWSMVLLGLVPDFTIAYIIANLSNGAISFFIVFILLQLHYLLIWAKNFLWGWIIFYLIQRNKMSSYICDFLSQNNFPDPGNYQESAVSYLESVASDSTLPVETRLRAAAELGAINSFMAQYKISLHTQISMAYEDAIEQYKILQKYKKR